jgi:hypothetical protein
MATTSQTAMLGLLDRLQIWWCLSIAFLSWTTYRTYCTAIPPTVNSVRLFSSYKYKKFFTRVKKIKVVISLTVSFHEFTYRGQCWIEKNWLYSMPDILKLKTKVNAQTLEGTLWPNAEILACARMPFTRTLSSTTTIPYYSTTYYY